MKFKDTEIKKIVGSKTLPNNLGIYVKINDSEMDYFLPAKQLESDLMNGGVYIEPVVNWEKVNATDPSDKVTLPRPQVYYSRELFRFWYATFWLKPHLNGTINKVDSKLAKIYAEALLDD